MKRRSFVRGVAAAVGVVASGVTLKSVFAREYDVLPARLVALIREVETPDFTFASLWREYAALSKAEMGHHLSAAYWAMKRQPPRRGASDYHVALHAEYANLSRAELGVHWIAAQVALRGGYEGFNAAFDGHTDRDFERLLT